MSIVECLFESQDIFYAIDCIIQENGKFETQVQETLLQIFQSNAYKRN